MQLINCLVALGDDRRNTVPKLAITVAEAAVLRAIHGNDSIHDIEPSSAKDVEAATNRLENEYSERGGIRFDPKTPGVVQVSNRGELARLKLKYGRARDEDGNAIVEIIYPGAAAQVFINLDDIGFPESCFKPTVRAAPVAAAPQKRSKGKPAPVVDTDDGDDLAELPADDKHVEDIMG